MTNYLYATEFKVNIGNLEVIYSPCRFLCTCGIAVLCRVVKNAVSVTSLNFSGCGLSWKSAEVLSEVIKV
jgi:hypothetical protein